MEQVVTVLLWHDKVTEALITCLKGQHLNTGHVHFFCLQPLINSTGKWMNGSAISYVFGYILQCQPVCIDLSQPCQSLSLILLIGSCGHSILFNNAIKTYYFLPSLFWPISIMWAGSRRNQPLFSPPPEISLLCDGNSVGHSTCASHLIPLIHHGSSLRNKRISQCVTAAPHPLPVNGNKEGKKQCLASTQQWVHWWAWHVKKQVSNSGMFPEKIIIFRFRHCTHLGFICKEITWPWVFVVKGRVRGTVIDVTLYPQWLHNFKKKCLFIGAKRKTVSDLFPLIDFINWCIINHMLFCVVHLKTILLNLWISTHLSEWFSNNSYTLCM